MCCVYGEAADAFFFHIAARRAKKMAAASRATPANAPMTIPAMAPPESFEPEPESEEEEVDGFDPEAGSVDAGEVDTPVVAAFELAAELSVVGVELRVVEAERTTLDRVPPRTCASCTTPKLDVQQFVDVPQHQRSLVAVPSQGTISVVPNHSLVSRQISRQPPPETSLLVQNSTH